MKLACLILKGSTSQSFLRQVVRHRANFRFTWRTILVRLFFLVEGPFSFQLPLSYAPPELTHSTQPPAWLAPPAPPNVRPPHRCRLGPRSSTPSPPRTAGCCSVAPRGWRSLEAPGAREGWLERRVLELAPAHPPANLPTHHKKAN